MAARRRRQPPEGRGAPGENDQHHGVDRDQEGSSIPTRVGSAGRRGPTMCPPELLRDDAGTLTRDEYYAGTEQP